MANFATERPKIGNRVSFLGAEGLANNGTLQEIHPCTTWGRVATVAWDDGTVSTGIRLNDLHVTSRRDPLELALEAIAQVLGPDQCLWGWGDWSAATATGEWV